MEKLERPLRDHLLLLEERLLQPRVRHSREELEALLADGFTEFGKSGRVYSRQQIIDGLVDSPTEAMSLTDFEVKLLAPEVALATYRVVNHAEQRAEMKRSLRSSIWVLRGGRWQMLFHQGTPTMLP